MGQDAESDKNYVDRLEAAKRGSTAQLLFKTSRLFQDYALELMRGGLGNQELRASHMSLMPHIDLEGTRLTLLAERVGISKQAVGQLVDDLEAMGLLERKKDPQDGRAKLILFSEQGKAGLLEGLMVLGEMEAALALKLGAQTMKAFHQTLLELEDLLVTQGVDALKAPKIRQV